MQRFFGRRFFDWAAFRRRLIGETSTWLSDAMDRPEQHPHIPMKRATDTRAWPPGLAEGFWRQVLELDSDPRSRN